MKFSDLISKHTFLILMVSVLFQNCNNAQEGDNTLAQIDSPSKEEINSSSKNVELNDGYNFISKVKLPKSIKKINAMATSALRLFVRENDKISVLSMEKKDKILGTFRLKNVDGNKLEGLTTRSRIAFSDDLEQLFVLTENDVHYYDVDGNYQGKLIKPLDSFEPFDLAFDLYNNGIYILSRADEVGEVFYWPSVDKEAETVLKGKSYELEIMSIESGFSSSRKNLWVLSTYKGTVHEIIQGNDNIWKEITKIDQSHAVNLAGLQGNMRSNMTDLFISGTFEKNGKIEKNSSSSIRICGMVNSTPNRNLYKGEVNSFPKEAMLDEETNQTIIQDFGFHMTYTLYILANNQIFEYKKERQ